MSAIVYTVHADHPEPVTLARVAAALADGAVVAYPTDTMYAIGCDPRVKQGVERLWQIKPLLRKDHHLTLFCTSLECIARYAHVDTPAYKLMKALTPGPYTFILKATKEVPHLVLNPKRKMVGLRVPNHPVCQGLLRRLDGLLVTTSAKLDSGDEAQTREELFDALARQVDILLDDEEPLHATPSTVLDLTAPQHMIVREGLGMEKLRRYLQ